MGREDMGRSSTSSRVTPEEYSLSPSVLMETRLLQQRTMEWSRSGMSDPVAASQHSAAQRAAASAAYSTPLSVAFSPDGESLATAGFRSVTIWSLATGKEIKVLRGHISQVRQAVFHPDGKRLASAGDDGTVKIWDVQTGQEVLTLRGHSGPVCDVAFSPDGRQLVSASRDGTVKIWDATPWVEPERASLGQAGKPSSSP